MSVSCSADVANAVRSIHGSRIMAVVYVTGGASQTLSWLLSMPGASQTILEATVPYSMSSFGQLVGHRRGMSESSFVSTSAARELAFAAYRRAVELAPLGAPVMGVAATCALASSHPKKGDHRAFVTVHADSFVSEYCLDFEKGARDRFDEDTLSSQLVVQAMRDAVTGPGELQPNGTPLVAPLGSRDSVNGPERLAFDDPVVALLRANDSEESTYHNPRLLQYDGGTWRIGAHSTNALLCGSFNPLHVGHRRLREATERILGKGATVGYELAACNADKPPLSPDTLRERAAQFTDEPCPLVVTREPLFVGKTELMPGTVFVVGHDTAIRIVSPKYYGGSQGLNSALLAMARNSCRFLVAGRRESPDAGPFLTLDDVEIPLGFEALFEQIPEELFREDISSTAIRKLAAQQADINGV